MVKVALAGAGNLGTSIALAISKLPQHSLVILSQKPRDDLTALGVPVSIIDYSRPETLVTALQGVHTVISVTFTFDPASFVSSQLTLLQAAKDAGVKRFAPSQWAFAEAASDIIGIYHPKAEIWKAVKESGLQYTAFRPGLYLNFMAFGSTKPELDERVFKASPKFPFCLNIAAGRADIPGSGEERLNITFTDDIAGFTAASLDTEWTTESGMAGSVTTFNELVSIAEKVTGKKNSSSCD